MKTYRWDPATCTLSVHAANAHHLRTLVHTPGYSLVAIAQAILTDSRGSRVSKAHYSYYARTVIFDLPPWAHWELTDFMVGAWLAGERERLEMKEAEKKTA